MVELFSRIFGPRFKIWLFLVVLGICIWLTALVSGSFKDWSAPRAGPSSLLIGFAYISFFILIPFGYLVEHAKAAVKIKFIGWIYFIYLSGAALIVGFFVWSAFGGFIAKGLRQSIFWENLIRVFVVLGVYSAFSLPLSILLAVVRKR